MSRDNYKVFSEGRIANLALKNRLVRSATGDNQMTTDGKTTDTGLKIYKDVAAGGVGMIITGVMAVMPANKTMANQPCIYSDEYIAEISKIADIVHQTDNRCAIIAQLNHAGRQVFKNNNLTQCVGPSAVESPILLKQARELSINEVQTIIKAFADAIARVKKAGFDGAQLHAAHGYLLSSFLSPYTNRRTDKFGGSVKNRVNIIKDIVSLAREKVGSFPLLIKINCADFVEGGIAKDNFAEFIKEIETTGVDAIEVSGGMWDCLARSEEELGFFPTPIPESRTRINATEKQSYFYDYVKNIDPGLPLILVGGHRNIELMENLLKEGKIDYLSLCRPLISEPDLPNRWLRKTGKDDADCLSCNACLMFLMKGELCCALKKKGLKKEAVENMFSQSWTDKIKF
jgi:2,4-dienoyl-CoA reductase-like NADH-dependent reductase (Old Yellow Enzyme family)